MIMSITIKALYSNNLVKVRAELANGAVVHGLDIESISSFGYQELIILLIKNGGKISFRAIEQARIRKHYELERMLIMFYNLETRKLAELLYY